MKNLLKAKRRKFNSKKGFTLVELIVAVIILLIVVSASVRGITISYRAASAGAVRNDAQSVAQRDCDFIMDGIAGIAERETFDALSKPTLNNRFEDMGTYCKIDDANFHGFVVADTRMGFLAGGYDATKYEDIQAIEGGAGDVASAHQTNYSNDPNKLYHYYTISRKDKQLTAASEVYQIYKITTYVYYSQNGYVTCEGEVCILPEIPTTP